MNIKEINLRSREGQLLWAAIIIFTQSESLSVNGEHLRGANISPDEALNILSNKANELPGLEPSLDLSHGHVRIKKARGGKFTVALRAVGNSKVLNSTETVNSLAAAKNNILAQIKAFQSPGIVVLDQTGEDVEVYWMSAFELEIQEADDLEAIFDDPNDKHENAIHQEGERV
jgi:uncharacterized protein YegP (UPF0339 family)